MCSDRSLQRQLGQFKGLVYAPTFQLSGHLDQLASDISVNKLTSASATASYVILNPSKYGRTAEGMPCEGTLRNQLSQLKGLVYAQKNKGEGPG
jgi:hypothetical protein